MTSTLHIAEDIPNSAAQPLLQTLPGSTQGKHPCLTACGLAGKGYESCAETRGRTGSAQTLFADSLIMWAHAYFNVKMSQGSSGLKKPNLFQTSCLVTNPLEPKSCLSSSCPHRGAQSGKVQGADMWDGLGQWLGKMAQVPKEIMSYLVRHLLCQVVGLLHLLCYETLRRWLRLLL